MNASGESVQAAAAFYKLPPEAITAFHDELDLVPGKVRVKRGGGAAGHNGLRSMDRMLGTPDYWRVRLGIGHPGDKERVLGHVLGDFGKDDEPWLIAAAGRGGRRRRPAGAGQAAGLHDATSRCCTQEFRIDGFQLRHRRPAQCRQIDPVQRADRHRRGAGGELSVLHHRAECRPRRRARSAAGRAGGDRQVGQDRPHHRWNSSTSPAWCAARRKGEGLGNQFLANIREVDAIIHVLRCFEDPDVTHVEGSIDPLRDAEVVETELMLADLDSLEKRLIAGAEEGPRRRQGERRRGGADGAAGRRVAGTAGRRAPRSRPGEEEAVRRLQLLTSKPVLYVCNVEEASAATGNAFSAPGGATGRGAGRPRVIVISAAIEAEVAQLPEADRARVPGRAGPARQRPGPGDPRRLRPAGADHLFHRAVRRRRAPGRSSRAPRRRRRPR